MLRALSLIISLIGLSACISRHRSVTELTTTTTTTLSAPVVIIETPVTTTTQPKAYLQLSQYCESSLKDFAGKSDLKALRQACETVQLLPGCESVNGSPIYHYNKSGDAKDPANILVYSLIHGDETPAGSVGRFWLERLETIVPRNNWRVIPILNPDGVKAKTRTNANKIDVNRNFPTMDWEEKAQGYWKRDSKSNPRRFPGFKAGSEPETQCAVKHIEDFKPDFIVSIHTPLKVLDYDGPKLNPPKFDYLPWRSLGHYPGSLGRYMWFERKVPVLTMELKEDIPNSNDPWLKLQDIIGSLVGLEQMSKPHKR
jgi:protein MpaA